MVELSLRAADRLADIEDYIANEGYPDTAERFVTALQVKAFSPGPVAPSIAVFYVSSVTGYAYQSFAHRGYRIVYTIIDERVIIVDFFHHARSTASMHRSLDGFRP